MSLPSSGQLGDGYRLPSRMTQWIERVFRMSVRGSLSRITRSVAAMPGAIVPRSSCTPTAAATTEVAAAIA